MKAQGITIQFTFPADWDTDEFVGELFGAFDEMAGRHNSELVTAEIVNEFGNNNSNKEGQQ